MAGGTMSNPWDYEYHHPNKSIRKKSKEAIKTFVFATAIVVGIYYHFLKSNVKPIN